MMSTEVEEKGRKGPFEELSSLLPSCSPAVVQGNREEVASLQTETDSAPPPALSKPVPLTVFPLSLLSFSEI